MIYYEHSDAQTSLGAKDLQDGLFQALDQCGKKKKVLVVPPDITRVHSQAGALTGYAFQYFGESLSAILPALGTHAPMSADERADMFGDTPEELFRVHDWRNGVTTIGEVPGSFVKNVTKGAVDISWPAQISSLMADTTYDLIVSIGQVVPHEVVGMANYTKNILVGTGGYKGINISHFIGAVYGMERIMGQAHNPVREVLQYAADRFLSHLPIIYVLTVVSPDEEGVLHVRGLFIGDDRECFNKAAALSQKVNITLLDKPLHKVVVYLDPSEYRSLWLGNKSIYRTRMALADGGELIVLAPAVKECGEDPTIDRLIRTYGYRGTKEIMALMASNEDLQENLGVAAHLIHGSTEGRFSVTYCPGKLNRKETEEIGYTYAELSPMMRRYNPKMLRDGFNTMPDGEEIFFIANPSLGLWSDKDRFAI